MTEATVLVGNYGSGKTELSLNLALDYAGKGSTALVDMDIVNPYFRSAEHKELLESAGVRVITPPYANTTVDVPTISAEIQCAFEYDHAVFDGGGDPVGAAVFGSVLPYFEKSTTQVWYVVNARRPLQRSAEEIIGMMTQISARARMEITGIVNNTNLARETTADDLAYGLEVCGEIRKKTGIPIVFSVGTEEVIRAFSKRFSQEKTCTIAVYTRPDWLDITAP